MPMEEHPQASLLGLPRELRDEILSHVLIAPVELSTLHKSWHNYKEGVSAYPPAICRVNRQLREESLPRFYSGNTFMAQISAEGLYDAFHRWIHGVGRTQVQYIRHLELRGWVQIPFGHMVQKRWLVALFDLRSGAMRIGDETVLASTAQLSPVKELEFAFAELVRMRNGKPFGALELEELVEGFYDLCITC
ncbi:hypothetical protein CKM354_001082700 [Cercospora kikuchii]|uniref:F-box domain-containing protein n=1 Tax=Cercospora kikuchii TaxID=84275 RepID=A0A9P3CR10_9PEZI|nr:uncharacterized protein CKM354_001082700 [Cercospora kikuchii]GIZ47742.1 hypothetical protein CKM354_001082700 [Cercospora kikuchii]